MAVKCTKLDRSGRARIADFCHYAAHLRATTLGETQRAGLVKGQGVEALLGAGARPNAQVTAATRVTRNGQVLMIGDHLIGATPFALAAKFAEGEIMRTLATAGADGVLPLRNGWTLR